MATPHKATPEQWEQLEDRAADHKFFFISSCVAELRSRVEALEAAANAIARYGRLAAAEQRIQALEGNRQAILDSSPAPAGELVQSVGAAICSIADFGDTPGWAPEARAAILAVAKWFDAMGYGATASILLQEVQRNG